MKDNKELLARNIGRALYADYVMLVSREQGSGVQQIWSAMLINVETGAIFKSQDAVGSAQYANMKLLISAMSGLYGKIFQDAKDDLPASVNRNMARVKAGCK